MSASPEPPRKPYSIGHVTKVTGVNVSTLRSWEAQGLIAAAKSAGGRRTFDEGDIRRIQEIDRLRRVHGYSLASLKQILAGAAAVAGEEPPSAVAAEPVEENRVDLVGARVRALRLEAGLTLRQVAEQTGLTPSHLSMFERGVAFPSPSRLNAIARLFNSSLAELLGGTRTSGQWLIRKGRGRIVGSFGPGVAVEQLTVSEKLMDCEIWTLNPGAESEDFYGHEGEELVHVLEGAFELTLAGDAPQVLAAGDSAYFDSTRQHRWRNASAGATVVLWVNTDTARLGSLDGHARAGGGRALPLGTPIGGGLGEKVHSLALPEGAQTFRVVDTHTAGHPTRILLEPLEGLEGKTVAAQREHFRATHDHLRSLLLHEPRGHAATFGLVPVRSSRADFGAIFISSYRYLDMCGHGAIGYARVLAALGRLNGRPGFSLEVPAGVVQVRLGQHGAAANVSVENVPSFLAATAVPLDDVAPGLTAAVAYGGCWYALVDAAALAVAIEPDAVARLMQLGGRIKERVNALLPGLGLGVAEIDSVLFHQNLPSGRTRQLVVLESNKFDRSPCGTGMCARMAELAATGRMRPGDHVEVENVLGVPFLGRLLAETTAGGRPAVVCEVTGRASLTGFATLIAERDDPLPDGFLCR